MAHRPTLGSPALPHHILYTPTTRLRRSTRIVSRQTPSMQPIRSRRPTSRNPHPLTSAMLAAFSGKIAPWSVQTPARSDASIVARRRAFPTPRPLAEAAT